MFFEVFLKTKIFEIQKIKPCFINKTHDFKGSKKNFRRFAPKKFSLENLKEVGGGPDHPPPMFSRGIRPLPSPGLPIFWEKAGKKSSALRAGML